MTKRATFTQAELSRAIRAADAAGKAGIQKSAHGLRKARATALSDSGATPHQIAAWTGHQSLSEVEHYTRENNRKIAVMGTERGRNSANPEFPSANRGKIA